MQRSQGDALLNGGHDLAGDEGGGGKLLAAVHHAMAHGVDLRGALDHAVLGREQGVQHGLDSLGVGRHGDFKFVFGIPGRDFVGQATVDADALAQTLGQHLAGLGVHELILQGGAAGVDDQDFHVYDLSFKFVAYGLYTQSSRSKIGKHIQTIF